jgi:hypothetical protein
VTVADRPKHYELIEGERVLGTVIQLPRAGGHLGTFLTVHTSTGLIAIAANPKRGATVLGRELERLQVFFEQERAVERLVGLLDLAELCELVDRLLLRAL